MASWWVGLARAYRHLPGTHLTDFFAPIQSLLVVTIPFCCPAQTKQCTSECLFSLSNPEFKKTLYARLAAGSTFRLSPALLQLFRYLFRELGSNTKSQLIPRFLSLHFGVPAAFYFPPRQPGYIQSGCSAKLVCEKIRGKHSQLPIMDLNWERRHRSFISSIKYT